jgi:hypothetical protein
MEAQKRSTTGGRRKGTPDKVTATARENIIAVFTRPGGADEMAEWTSANATEFYRHYARLIPVQGERNRALTDHPDPVRPVGHVPHPHDVVPVRVAPQWRGVARARLR